MAFPMIQRWLFLFVIQFSFVAGAFAESTGLTGKALRQAVSGRTVLIETPIGSFPIRYKGDGTMAGQAPLFVASLGSKKDNGQWWIAGDRLCQRWHRWMDAQRYCFRLQRIGAKVHWLRDDGLSGTATISAPVTRLR